MFGFSKTKLWKSRMFMCDCEKGQRRSLSANNDSRLPKLFHGKNFLHKPAIRPFNCHRQTKKQGLSALTDNDAKGRLSLTVTNNSHHILFRKLNIIILWTIVNSCTILQTEPQHISIFHNIDTQFRLKRSYDPTIGTKFAIYRSVWSFSATEVLHTTALPPKGDNL